MKIFDHVSGEFLATDGAKIYYEITGNKNKPVLLLLHGGFGNIEDFNTILPKLYNEFRIIAVDSRGHGKSTLGSRKLSYEQMQKDVESLLAYLKIDALNIIGFSDGGVIAYRIASLTSLKITKLITIGSDWHLKNVESVRDIFLQITGERWRKKFPDTYDVYQKLNPEPDFNFLTESIVNMWLDATTSGYPNDNVKNICCPLLIVRGDDDHLISREAVVELSRLVENSRLLNIPFSGHVAFEDQEEIFMLSLSEFLK
jgi:pimeloyl-ACP methyl ester carboxylesterase